MKSRKFVRSVAALTFATFAASAALVGFSAEAQAKSLKCYSTPTSTPGTYIVTCSTSRP